jgi:hypothetical protein
MITLIPINKNIQATLHEKIGMLGRDDLTPPINETQTDEKGVAPENYMFTRVPFLRAVSFTQKSNLTKDKNKVVILSGGKLSKWGRLRAGFSDRNVDVNDTISLDKKLNEFGLYTAPNSDIVDDIPYRPIAGVKDINIDYKGGGMMLGATRTAQMSWTCWTWEELDELTPHFLTPGRTVLLEWGWSGLGKLQDTQLLPIIKADSSEIDTSEISNLQQTILQHIIDQKGHYDAMLGLVQTFDWTVRDDGGFDCSTTLVAPGVTMLQQFVKNLNSKAYSELPGAVTQTQEKKEPWFWFNTDEKWELKNKNIGGLAPYITFKEYMSDFTSQVQEFVKEKGNATWMGSPISRFQIMTLGKIKQQMKNGVPVKGSLLATVPFSVPTSRQAWGHGGSYFVTWGWFEDNVLSRFFGQVSDTQNEKSVVGEFRSFEQDIDAATGEFKVTGGPEKKPIYRATRMYNSRYLVTVDSAQWLIPNENDPVMLMAENDQPGNISALKEVRNGGGYYPETAEELIAAKATLANLKEPGPWENNKWNSWRARSLSRMKADKDGIAMRDIYFNAGYLQEKLKNVNDLMQGVMSIWDEFSSTYGGIYSFHVDYDDNGNRLIIRERGYAGKRALDLLSAEERSSIKDSTGLFEFPIWEKGSIVKSNSLNGKLPDRMKLAAMYGANSIKGKEEDDDNEVQGTYDELAGKAWGNLQAPKSKDGATEDEIRQDRYDDLMSGRLDYPSRDNRSFGQVAADMDKNLTIGDVAPWVKEDDKTKGKAWTKLTPNTEGIQIYDTIKDNIEASAKAEMLERARQVAGTEDIGGGTVDDIVEAQKAAAIKFEAFNSTQDSGGNIQPTSQEFYELKNLDDSIPGYTKSSRPVLKNEYKFAMQKLLRGDDDGVMRQVDPLIPIDFEMEIDGTGGLFPGNSFQSTYLPKRYREEALLQMTKVNHKVSSDGWWVTIKGQMRAVSNFDEKIAERAKRQQAEAEKQAALDAAAARAAANKLANANELKTVQMNKGKMTPSNAIKLLDTSFKPKTLADMTTAGDNKPRVVGEKASDYDAANIDFKNNKLIQDNINEKLKQDKTSISTLTFLQNQFNSGNVDWAQDESIVLQLQQTITNFGFPIPESMQNWWPDGDFGKNTRAVLADFLRTQEIVEDVTVLSERALGYLYSQGQ